MPPSISSDVRIASTISVLSSLILTCAVGEGVQAFHNLIYLVHHLVLVWRVLDFLAASVYYWVVFQLLHRGYFLGLTAD